MKKLVLILTTTILLGACGSESENKEEKKEKNQTEEKSVVEDENKKIEETENKKTSDSDEEFSYIENACDCNREFTNYQSELLSYLKKTDENEIRSNENLNAAVNELIQQLNKVGARCRELNVNEEQMAMCDNFTTFKALNDQLKAYKPLLKAATE